MAGDELARAPSAWWVAIRFLSACLIIAAVLLAFFVGMSRDSIYVHEEALAAQAVGSGGIISLVFPLLALWPGAVGWVTRWRGRALVNVHHRRDLRTFLVSRLGFAALSGFSAVTLIHTLVFLGALYILPVTGWVAMDTDLGQFADGESPLHSAGPFAAVAGVHPLAWAIVNAAWQGLWAALFAALACVLTLVQRSYLLALATPIIFYYAASFLLGALPPWHVVLAMVIFPVMWGVSDPAYYLLPLLGMVAVVMSLAVHGLRRLSSSALL